MALQRGHIEVADLIKKKLTEPLPQSSVENPCTVCLDGVAEVVLIPCGHRGAIQ